MLFWFSQENCSEVIFSNDAPFKRLDHYKLHEYTRKWNFSSSNKEPVTMTLSTSIDAMFKRKRGRPPKNRVIEVRTYKFLKELIISFCAYFSLKQSKVFCCVLFSKVIRKSSDFSSFLAISTLFYCSFIRTVF